MLFPACHSRRALYHESAASSACRLPRRAVRVFEEPVSVLQRCYMTGSIAHPAEAVRVSRTGALLIVRFRLERRAALSHSVPLVRLRHGRGRALQGSGSRLRSPRTSRGDPLRGPSNPSAVRWRVRVAPGSRAGRSWGGKSCYSVFQLSCRVDQQGREKPVVVSPRNRKRDEAAQLGTSL